MEVPIQSSGSAAQASFNTLTDIEKPMLLITAAMQSMEAHMLKQCTDVGIRPVMGWHFAGYEVPPLLDDNSARNLMGAKIQIDIRFERIIELPSEGVQTYHQMVHQELLRTISAEEARLYLQGKLEPAKIMEAVFARRAREKEAEAAAARERAVELARKFDCHPDTVQMKGTGAGVAVLATRWPEADPETGVGGCGGLFKEGIDDDM